MTIENQVNTGENKEVAVPAEAASSTSPSEQSSSQEQMVPLTALQSERAQRQQVQDELKMIKDHLNILQSNQAQQAQKPKDDFEGLEDSDVLTIGEFKKATSRIANNFQMTLEELKISQKYPDYQEIITKYLPEVIKQDPDIGNSLRKTQDYNLAYKLAKMSDGYRDDNKKSKKNADAQRIVENSQKAGNLSSIGSTSPISQAKRYKDMSDADFRELVNKNMGAF